MADHLVVAPVLVPLAAAALVLLAGERRRNLGAAINVMATLAGLAVAMALLWRVQAQEAAAFSVALPGNWPVPFGIVLVADRLSALMCVLAGCAGLAALLFALARWHRAGAYFHALFQLQLMGLYGAFLTGDLFNLFVFFEVMLAASYGLLLHGSGSERVRTGLHYLAVNLIASLLFLIGVALLYGVAGTLNMADLARKLALVPPADRGLLHAGAAILAIAFLAKAAVWPLNFWLPPAYAAASAPAAALFAILTKVGVYGVLRVWTLCFPSSGAQGAEPFGEPVLLWGGMATLAFGAIGMLASQRLACLAGYSIIASSGTLVAAIGFQQPALTAGALFYLASSTLAGCALFLLVELMDRAREIDIAPPMLDDGEDHLPDFIDAEPPADVNLDDDEEALIGRAIPAALALLSLAFLVCALVLAGLPPLSGFVGKLAMLTVLTHAGPAAAPAAWSFYTALIGSGLFAATALMRVGMRHFWGAQERPVPRLRIIEGLPIALLLGACVLLTVRAEPVLAYMRATAESLHQRQRYIDAVLAARSVLRNSQGVQP
jgi:multicomponent K+:H+ antiporter subunit D